MKRVICLLLVACFMIAALVSCGGAGDTSKETKKSGESTAATEETANGSEDTTPAGETTPEGETTATDKPAGSEDATKDTQGGNEGQATNPSTPGDVETDEYGQESFTSPNDYESIASDPEVEGESISIIVREQLSVMREWYKDALEDEVDEVIAMRNESVSQILGVEVNYALLGNNDYEDCLNAFNAAIIDDVDGGYHYYDVAANYAYAGANSQLRGYLANMADKEVFPYFDFSLPCWNQSIVKTTLLEDQLYYITGDLNLSTFDKTMVVFVNKDLYNDNKTADDAEDLQDVALDGKWDYEDLYRWASVYEDTGDGVPSHDDIYGISAGFNSIPLDALPYAWDLDFLVTEEDGSHSYNVAGNAKISEALDRAKALFSGHAGGDRVALADGVGNWNDTGTCSMGGYSEPISHFAAGTSVFAIHLLYCTTDDNLMLRNMENEFGLLPMPKYDEDQANYGTTAHDAYTLMTILDHSKSSEKTKGKAVSGYLQLSSEESYTNVRGYYINEIVKQKYFGLTESVEKSQAIFDIIADNVEFEFISIYAPQLNNVLNSCWREVITGDNNVGASTAEEAFSGDQVSYETALEEVDSWLGLI